MYDEFPSPIINETDLVSYQKYLEREFAPPQNENTLLNKLNRYIGALIKIDLFSPYRTDSRSGILKETGQDYLVLKTQTTRESFIPFYAVKSITVLQNNTKLPHF